MYKTKIERIKEAQDKMLAKVLKEEPQEEKKCCGRKIKEYRYGKETL